MTLQEQILSALQAAAPGGPLVDPRNARNLLLSLSRALGGSVEDETNYKTGRAYHFAHSVRTEEDRRWRTILLITISSVGPFATHTAVLRNAEERWWSHNVRTSRSGFHPEDAAVIERLRAWYQENGLTEVDVKTQALPAPQPQYPEDTPLFQALFRP